MELKEEISLSRERYKFLRFERREGNINNWKTISQSLNHHFEKKCSTHFTFFRSMTDSENHQAKGEVDRERKVRAFEI